MIRSSRHGNDKQSLDEDTKRKGIHREAGGIDFSSEKVYNACWELIVAVMLMWSIRRCSIEQRCWPASPTWCFFVAQENSLVSCKLFQRDRQKRR